MQLIDILSKYDNKAVKGFDESDLSIELSALSEDEKAKDEVLAESLAFTLVENCQNEDYTWGTYFGPMWISNDGKGNVTEAPSINYINKDVIDYWEQRIDKTDNPILKARYAGLVWDFKYKQTNEKPDFSILTKYIEALLNSVEGNYQKHSIIGFNKLKRAFELSVRTKQNTLLERTKKILLDYEDATATDNTPGLWGVNFMLMLDYKDYFTQEEKSVLVSKLEDRLNRLKVKSIDDVGSEKLDPWIIRDAAMLLAQFYKKENDTAKLENVLTEIEIAYRKIFNNASSLQVVGWLKDIYSIYSTYNFAEKAKNILAEIQRAGEGIMEEMQKHEVTQEIPTEEMKAYVDFMMQGTDDEIYQKFAYKYIPDKEDAKQQILKQVQNAPLYYMFPNQLLDEKGRVKSVVGNIDTDLEGHIVLHISQSMQISYVFMRAIIQEAISRNIFTTEKIVDFLKSTPIIENSRYEIIKQGLNAYLNNDYISCIHLLIPQIENAIRNIIDMSGSSSLKPQKNGKGFQLRTFDDILRDNIIEASLGDDFSNYLRILFTDQRGWNLRNDVCHGIAPITLFNQMTADRILHALLCLGVIRWKD